MNPHLGAFKRRTNTLGKVSSSQSWPRTEKPGCLGSGGAFLPERGEVDRQEAGGPCESGQKNITDLFWHLITGFLSLLNTY